VIHLRIVSPPEVADEVVDGLCSCASVIDVVHLPGVARHPDGDLISCDVAREDASVVLADLRRLGLEQSGSIALSFVDAALSDVAHAAEHAAAGSPADAVVWENVTEVTSESASLSVVFLTFIVLAGLIASVGIYLNSPILVVGAMVVGPEFGPIAGFCIAIVRGRSHLAAKSALALLVGFPLTIAVVFLCSLAFKATGVTPETFSSADHGLATTISNPDFLAFFVAFCAGVAGVLSLTTSKSGALIGVLISLTTIPAAANIGVAAAYSDWSALVGSAEQLGLNLGAVLVAGTLTLAVQLRSYRHRREHHRSELGLPQHTHHPHPARR
jgi:uncharacterized hydrophobic protein (TIGR00271 family)